MLQPIVISETPEPGSSAAKRSREVLVDHHVQATSKKRRTEFIDVVVEAVTSDRLLHDLLNIVEFEHGEDKERVVIVTTKKLDYHEPMKHVSRVRLVLTGDRSYYIQVKFNVAGAFAFLILAS